MKKNARTSERRRAQSERLRDPIVQLRIGSAQMVEAIRAFTTAIEMGMPPLVGDIVQTLRKHFNAMHQAKDRLAASNADREMLAALDDCVLLEGAAFHELDNVLAKRVAAGASRAGGRAPRSGVGKRAAFVG